MLILIGLVLTLGPYLLERVCTQGKYRRDIWGCFSGLDDVFAQLDDNQALLQTMLASRFVAGIRQQVEIWDKKLARVSETLDEWLAVQRAWMYLESIFGAPDIQKHLPLETVHFLRVDQSYVDMMRKTKTDRM